MTPGSATGPGALISTHTRKIILNLPESWNQAVLIRVLNVHSLDSKGLIVDNKKNDQTGWIPRLT